MDVCFMCQTDDYSYQTKSISLQCDQHFCLAVVFLESLVSVDAEVVDLTGPLLHASVEERTSWTVGALCEKLDKVV